MIPEETIREAARRLGEAAGPARVILFGSYARGDADEGSDLDFLVVRPEKVRGRRAEMARLREAIAGLPISADVLVTSQDEVADWATIPGSVLVTAAREGRVLADHT